MKQFYDYFIKFYGPKGLYPNKKGKLKLSDINKAVSVYLAKNPNREFYGDSPDREAVRDVLIKQKKLEPDYKNNEEKSAMKLKDLIKEQWMTGWTAPPKDRRWSKSTTSTGLTEFERKGGKDTINETLPAFPREWKNLEKAEKIYEKAIIDLGKAVAKQDRKKGQLIPALYKTLNATMKKFKEMLNTEILSKLQ